MDNSKPNIKSGKIKLCKGNPEVKIDINSLREYNKPKVYEEENKIAIGIEKEIHLGK